MFKEKKYAFLPEIKIKSRNEKSLQKLDIDYLREKTFEPDAILNEAALLGWSVIDKEKQLDKAKSNEKDHLLLDIAFVVEDFDLTKVDDEHSEFIQSRLFYLNNKCMIRRYLKTDPKYRTMFQTDFKGIFRKYFKNHENEINTWNEDHWVKVIELVVVRKI